ncbi:hypothetical protein [Clostridium coskatii]|uniref:Uncharacterized protein n=1 Tax=Clostridium coskatii TaxID=1705578 RepID=A0A166S5X6_9CLOT|nr:hypothetical protein [Clostridium coskatii]OAA91691.1 hypothetical protein WX73_01576 [Clostridium coskatii]OBR97640.1 hypothetical protein CLCOS_01100 [Clostridium coskatii]
MIGKIIDMNITDALVSFQDGTTANVGATHLPPDSKIGDRINIHPISEITLNDKYKQHPVLF